MKRTFFTLTLLLPAVFGFAQWTGGMKAGFNLGTMKFKASGSSTSEDGVGFHIGGYANFAISDPLSVQSELLLNSIGISSDGYDNDRVSLNYLSVPVMLLYNLNEYINLQAGPQFGVLLFTDPSQEGLEIFKRPDFSLNMGAGLSFEKMNITLRYCFGLANVAGDDVLAWMEASGFEDIEIKNNNFQISIGYKLFEE